MIYFIWYGLGFVVSLVVFSAAAAFRYELNGEGDVATVFCKSLFWPLSWLIAIGAFIGRDARNWE